LAGKTIWASRQPDWCFWLCVFRSTRWRLRRAGFC